jgi:PAS domain S-box-containing protein
MTKKPKPSRQGRSRKTSVLQHVGYGTDSERAALLERLPDAFVSVDPRWHFTYVNAQAETLFGKKREELLGRNVWEVFPVPGDSVVYQNAHEALEKQSSLVFSDFHPLLNKWYSVRIHPFQDGLYAFGLDITERKQAEEQLQFHTSTVWDARKSIIVTDLQGKIIYWNEGASHLFGYTAQEALGNTPALVYPHSAEQQLASDLEQILNGQDYRGRWQGRRKDGSSVWIDIKTTLLRDRAGKSVGFIGIAQEAATQGQVEDHFLYYAQVAQNQLDAVIMTDTNYSVLRWNEAAEKLYGWKQEEVLGKFVDTFFCTVFCSTTVIEARTQLLNRGYWKGKVLQKRKDGSQLLILASVAVIRDGAGNMVGAIAANREMSEYEENTLLENTNQLI